MKKSARSYQAHFILLLLSLFGLAAHATEPTNPLPARLIFASSEYQPHYGTDLPKQGAVIEIVRRAFASQGIHIEIAFMPFARALHDTQHGQYAGVIAIWHTAERTKHLLFSEPIYANKIVLFKRVGEFEQYNSIEEIPPEQATLGMVTGYAQHAILQNSPLNKVSVATDEQIFRMLTLSRVDLVPADLHNGLHILKQLQASETNTDITWLEEAIESKNMHLALPRNRPESAYLLTKFNQGLQVLHASGELQSIMHELLPASKLSCK